MAPGWYTCAQRGSRTRRRQWRAAPCAPRPRWAAVSSRGGRLHDLAYHGLEDGLVRRVVHPVLERKVDRVALGVVGADVLDVARAREVLAELVEGDGHHAVGGVEGLLDAVAVVDVDVDVQHALVVLEQLEDGEHDVVGIAEARRLALLGVVEPARPVDRDVGVRAVELHRAADRAARARLAEGVHAVEDRAVLAHIEALRKAWAPSTSERSQVRTNAGARTVICFWYSLTLSGLMARMNVRYSSEWNLAISSNDAGAGR